MSGQGATTDVIVGSTTDMVSRMRAVMPAAWFPVTTPDSAVSATPVLDGILTGIGLGWSYCHALAGFVIGQARIATASGGFLDMICADFFGASIVRKVAEADSAFQSRIRANLLLPRATRSALSATIEMLLGRAPLILEPLRAADTGGYGGPLASAAGGGGGYGTAALALGSALMPFQFLVTVVEYSGWTRRESEASFIDSAGQLQIAPRHILRQSYVNGVSTGLLSEARSFNLIKDSIGWSTWPQSSANGDARWTVDPTGARALWAGYPVLQVTLYSGGAIVGPLVTVATAGGPVTASVWLQLPADLPFEAFEIMLRETADVANSTQVAANIAIVGSWQRVVVTLPATTGAARNVSLVLLATSSGLMNTPVLTQCWQIEPGTVATSYIPSSHQIGIREADDLVLFDDGVSATVDPSGLDEAIGRVIPAGSIAWTTLIG